MKPGIFITSLAPDNSLFAFSFKEQLEYFTTYLLFIVLPSVGFTSRVKCGLLFLAFN